MQATFAVPVREGRGYTAFDEGAIFEELKVWLCEKWAVDRNEAAAAVDECSSSDEDSSSGPKKRKVERLEPRGEVRGVHCG